MGFIATAISAIAGGSIGNLLLKVGIGTGLGFLLNALAPKPEASKLASRQPGGVSLDIKLGSVVPRTIPFGRCSDSGHFVYWNLYGSKDQFLQLVYVLGDTWLDSLQHVYVDGKRKALIPTTNEGGAVATYLVEDFGSSIKVRWFDGRPGQAADTELTAHDSPNGRWSANNKFVGMAYVSLTLEWHKDRFSAGQPEFNWVFYGARLYDWRKDSTNGGVGPHRWNDKTTWQYSNNPAVMRYNYCRGFFTNSQRIAGMGLPASTQILALYTAAANVCDEQVSTPEGLEDRYKCSLIVTDDQQHADVISMFDQCMAAGTLERQGQFAPLVGAAYSIVDTITDDDFVRGQRREFTAKRSRHDLVNAVFGQFLDPGEHWEMNDYPAITDAGYETEDGERLVRDRTDFRAVISVHQAQRLATIVLNQSRYQGTAVGTVGFSKVWWQTGDWITWTSTKYGWTKKFQIVRRQIQHDPRRVYVELQEVDNAIYTSLTTVVLDTAPTSPTSTKATTVSGFGVAAETINSGNKRVPALRFTYTPEDDPTVHAILVEYRRLGQTTKGKVVRDDSPLDGSFQEHGSILPNVAYEARANLVTRPARTTTWTAWTSTTTTDAREAYEQLDDQLQQNLDILRNTGANTFSDVLSRVQSLEAEVDTKNHVFYQASPPTSTPSIQLQIGDLWFDSDDQNKMYRWNGAGWINVALSGGIHTYAQAAAPSGAGLVVGDMWVDTDDKNKLYRWSGAVWVVIRDTDIQANATAILAETTARNNADVNIYDSLNAVSNRFAVKAHVFLQATAPTTGPTVTIYQGVPPAPVVTTEPLRDGDVWFETDAGNKMYRYSTATSTWVAVPDNNRTRAFAQNDPPAASVGLNVNDIWIDTNGSAAAPGAPPVLANTMYRWNGTAWVLARDALIDNVYSGLGSETKTRSDKDTAVASIMNFVWAEVKKVNAGGFFRLVTSNSAKPADTFVRFEVFLNVGSYGGYVGTSTTNLTIGKGSKSFTTQAGKLWVVNQRLRASNAAGTLFVEGRVTSYSGTTLVINVDTTKGSGANASWNIAEAKFISPAFTGDVLTTPYNAGSNIYKTAGFFLDIVDDGLSRGVAANGIPKSRAMFDVNQFIVGSGATKGIPFKVIGSKTYIHQLFVDGGLSTLTANVGTLTAGMIKSGNGKVQLDLTNAKLLFYD